MVTSPELVTAVSRNSNSLSFNPFISEVEIRLMQVDEATKDIINENLNGERGQWGYVIEVHDRPIAAIGPGRDLNVMTSALLVQIAAHLHRKDKSARENETVTLHQWCRHLFTVCSTTALYGPNNSFLTEPELERFFG